MKKKITQLVILGVIVLSATLYHYSQRPKNIFDEIYQETKKTYQSNNILGEIDGFEIRGDWSTDDPNVAKTPFGKYNDETLTDNDYYDVYIDFNFKTTDKLASIFFTKKLNTKISLSLWNTYRAKGKTLTKTVEIVIKENDGTDKYIENEPEVRSYLKEYGITPTDLDNYYDEIVNQKVLTDWCSIYDSHFSPDNYGEVTVETQWENW